MFGVSSGFIEQLSDLEMKKSLEQVSACFEEKNLEVFGKTIRYSLGGTGEKIIVILPGTTGRSMNYFKYLLALRESATIIAINYPIVSQLSELTEQIRMVIKNETASKVTLFGHSLGGIVAQEIMREAPELVEKMILVNTYGRTADIPAHVLKGHKEGNDKLIKTFRSFAFGFLRKGFARRITAGIDRVEVAHKDFWKKYYAEIFNHTTPDEMKSHYGLMASYWANQEMHTPNANGWDGKVIVIESEIDSASKVPEKEALKKLYPACQLEVLEGSSNMFIVRHEEKIIEIIQSC